MVIATMFSRAVIIVILQGEGLEKYLEVVSI